MVSVGPEGGAASAGCGVILASDPVTMFGAGAGSRAARLLLMCIEAGGWQVLLYRCPHSVAMGF